MKKIAAFLDTNILLHYQPFDQIDWPTVLKGDFVTLVFIPTVISELDKHKINHSQDHIRKRAAALLTKVEGLFSAGDANARVKVRRKTEAYYEHRHPTLDFASNNLHKEIQDDWVIASILHYKAEHPDEPVVLVAADTAIRMKARPYGIRSENLPDDLKLPEQADPTKKALQEAQTKLQRLEHRLPKLQVAFMDGKHHATCTLPADFDPAAWLWRQMNEIRGRYPYLPINEARPQTGRGFTLDDLRKVTDFTPTLSPHQKLEYNQELDTFYEEWEQYLRALARLHQSVELKLQIVNRGSGPAEDIDALLSIPPKFAVYTARDEDEREPPTPPEMPEPQTLYNLGSMLNANIKPVSLADAYASALYAEGQRSRQNVSPAAISESVDNGSTVHIHVKKLKQNIKEALETLFVIPPAEAASFEIPYRINAQELPDETQGTLYIQVQRVATA